MRPARLSGVMTKAMQFARTGESQQSEADGEAPEASDRQPMAVEPPAVP